MPPPSPPPLPPHLHHDGIPSQPSPPQKPNQKFLSLILKSVIMFFLTFFFFLLLPLASVLLLIPLFLRHQYHRRHFLDSPSSGISPKHLKKLPQFKFCRQTSSTNFSPDCVVCLDGFRQGQWCRILPGCGHVFHRKCVDNWLVKVAACPVCRTRVCSDQVQEKEIQAFGARMRQVEIS